MLGRLFRLGSALRSIWGFGQYSQRGNWVFVSTSRLGSAVLAAILHAVWEAPNLPSFRDWDSGKFPPLHREMSH